MKDLIDDYWYNDEVTFDDFVIKLMLLGKTKEQILQTLDYLTGELANNNTWYNKLRDVAMEIKGEE